MKKKRGFVVLESGEIFPGEWHGGSVRAGELVFNTSHTGYEEMATDPSYYSQILITTASQQGNYGDDDQVWESQNIWIHGFVCLELQDSRRDQSWKNKLLKKNVPIVSEVDTRALTLRLREGGTTWGALVEAESESEALKIGRQTVDKQKSQDSDWTRAVSVKEVVKEKGANPSGSRICLLDFGCKKNIVRELKSRCAEVIVMPGDSSAEKIRAHDPQGIVLSNGPGNPEEVRGASETVRELLGWRPIFGICMGHQILGRALGAKTYRLKYGHRGSNHPIRDDLLSKIYMTSQNHGYAIEEGTLPDQVRVTHRNLNDQTVAGIEDKKRKAFSVQFHPESHPGPHDSVDLFDYFLRQTK